MSAIGLITTSGRILTARLLKGDGIAGITHCALGYGDDTFTDPRNPPDPSVDQFALRNEFCRKAISRVAFLEEFEGGPIVANGVAYRETESETRILGFFFSFNESEANAHPTKEYGFFGGTVAFTDEVHSGYAEGGVYDPETNPTGQVLVSGYLYEIKHIPDFNKTSDTRFDLVGVIKI